MDEYKIMDGYTYRQSDRQTGKGQIDILMVRNTN